MHGETVKFERHNNTSELYFVQRFILHNNKSIEKNETFIYSRDMMSKNSQSFVMFSETNIKYEHKTRAASIPTIIVELNQQRLL
jgi:hypothetical protein